MELEGTCHCKAVSFTVKSHMPTPFAVCTFTAYASTLLDFLESCTSWPAGVLLQHMQVSPERKIEKGDVCTTCSVPLYSSRDA